MRSFVLAFAFCASGRADPDDVGYEKLFEDANEEIMDAELSLVGEPIPDWVDGVFYQTGPASWSNVEGKLAGNAIFGYGKVHKWDFHRGKVTFSTKFPKKGMLNNVNTWLLKDKLQILTDMIDIVEVDPDTLEFEDSITKFQNSSGIHTAGSAHPHCMDDGSYLGLRGDITGLTKGKLAVYKLHPESPDVLQDIVSIEVPKISYTHAFGLTRGMEGGDYVVVVAQPVYLNGLPDKNPKTHVHLLPMDGGATGKKQVSIEMDPFYFGHFANTFSSGAGKITFDLDRQQDIFFNRFNMDTQLNKTARDNWARDHDDAYSTLTRYEVDLNAETITEKKLFPDPKTQCAPESLWCEFDLFALHPDDFGKDYCGFWAQHVYYNSSSFGSQGVVRVELCGNDGPKVVASWYQKNAYPGEAQFVPKPGATDKTEGVVIFKTYEGDTGLSKIIVADAKTLKTMTTATLPVRVPFTVHGNFYPRKAVEGGSCIAVQSEHLVV